MTVYDNKKMYRALILFDLFLLVCGFVLSGPAEILSGLKTIVLSNSVLITDYMELAGTGTALVNSSLITAVSLFVIYKSWAPVNGFTIVTIGHMSGFSMFGKNIINIWPTILGTYLYSKYKGDSFGKHVNTALLSSSLAPLISFILVENGFSVRSVFTALIVGVLVGFVVPAVASFTLKFQYGMNLYNTGFATGLVGIILVSLMATLGYTPQTVSIWSKGNNVILSGMLCGLFAALVIAGFIMDRGVFKKYFELLKTTGRAPMDYMQMFGGPTVMVNTGINGMIATCYILFIGGDLNGPTIGGIFSVMCFSAYGKHARNILPVMAGIFLGGVFKRWRLTDNGVQMAALYGTTLAPISGCFGLHWGVIAGFLHSSLVLRTGMALAGLNLYNNGFSGGILVIVLLPIILDISKARSKYFKGDEKREKEEKEIEA